MFKFIHTADIHLDSPLKSLALRNPQVADLVGGATRRTFQKIIDLCIEEQVHALIIGGDLYDGDLRSMKTAAFLNQQMRRLEEVDIKVFMIRGNHDSESSITRHLNLPANVHVFTGHGGVEELRDHGVAIHGVSFAQRHAPDSLLAKYKKPISGLINIGIMHTSLAGAAEHDVYAPCSLNELSGHGFDYWALGHIHRRRVYSEKPFVVMPGIPQGRDIGEDGSKSVTIVEASDQKISLEERFVADSEFQRVRIDLSHIGEWHAAMQLLCNMLTEAKKNSKAQFVICRIVLVGLSPLYWLLKRDIDLFQEEAHSMALHIKDLFLDGIENHTEASERSPCDSNPVDELNSLMLEVSMKDDFRENATSFMESVVNTLPAELRDCYGIDQAGREKILLKFLYDGRAAVIASLKGNQTDPGKL